MQFRKPRNALECVGLDVRGGSAEQSVFRRLVLLLADCLCVQEVLKVLQCLGSFRVRQGVDSRDGRCVRLRRRGEING